MDKNNNKDKKDCKRKDKNVEFAKENDMKFDKKNDKQKKDDCCDCK